MSQVYEAPYQAFEVLMKRFAPNSDFTILKNGEVLVWPSGLGHPVPSGYRFEFLTLSMWGPIRLCSSGIQA